MWRCAFLWLMLATVAAAADDFSLKSGGSPVYLRSMPPRSARAKPMPEQRKILNYVIVLNQGKPGEQGFVSVAGKPVQPQVAVKALERTARAVSSAEVKVEPADEGFAVTFTRPGRYEFTVSLDNAWMGHVATEVIQIPVWVGMLARDLVKQEGFPTAKNPSDRGEVWTYANWPNVGFVISGTPEAVGAIDLPGTEAAIEDGDTLIIWNTHASVWKDKGTVLFSVQLRRHGTPLWEKRGISIEWNDKKNPKAEVRLPAVKYDSVCIAIAKYRNEGRFPGGGLSEIEVIRGGQNIARGRPARASAPMDPERPTVCAPLNVTDGIIHEEGDDGKGWWALPPGKLGWIEVDLAR